MFRSLTLLAICAFFTIGGVCAQQASSASNVAPAHEPAAVASPASRATESAEDWAKLTVDRAKVKPILPGYTMGRDDRGAYTRELVRLEWRHGDFIDLNVVKPNGVKKPRVILYLYSFPSDTSRFQNDGWCRRVTHDGFAAVGFVSALTGERFANRPMREWFISQLQESLSATTHDVQLIIDYLDNRGDLDVSQVGMWGQGSGGSIAILAAAADPRIKAIDVLNPWGDWPDWLKDSPEIPAAERDKYLTAEFLKAAAVVDPVQYLPQLRDREVRVQQVMDDASTPETAKSKIAAAVPPGKLVQYKDAAAHREAWQSTGIAGWLAARLQPTPAPVAAAASGRPAQP